jgi:ABC-2 type transport system permease protein
VIAGGLVTNLRVIGALGARSVRQTMRRPQLVSPIIVFPTILLAVQTGNAGRAINLPGFPHVESFLAFMLAGAMLQSTLLAGNSGGIAMAIDIEMGFTDRLLAAPISRFTMVLGRLAGTVALGALAAIWFLVLGVIFGAPIHEGILGAIVVVILVALSALCFGGLGSAIALYSGKASVVQGLFPLVFVVLFVSNAFFPANLILEPAQTISRYNPLSLIIDGVRDPIISSFSASDMLAALGAIAGLGAIGIALSAWALRARLRGGGA